MEGFECVLVLFGVVLGQKGCKEAAGARRQARRVLLRPQGLRLHLFRAVFESDRSGRLLEVVWWLLCVFGAFESFLEDAGVKKPIQRSVDRSLQAFLSQNCEKGV